MSLNNMQLIDDQNFSKKLSQKVTHSAIWIFLFQIFDNGLGLLRLIILARILTPNDFGLVAIAWIILQTISTFTQTGVHQTLIHKPQIEKYLNSAWTYLFFRGIILYTLIFLCAPILGNFFNAESSVPIIRVISLSLLFDSITNIGVIYFQKNLLFNRQFVYQITGNIVDFLVTVILAIIFKDVWAILYGSIANNTVRVILSYILLDYRPKFEFDYSRFRELNNYGKWIAWSNILQFIYSQGDDLLVGKILGSVPLGYYQLGYRISNLPATQITHIISSVMFPAYSKIQGDKERIAKIYLSVLQVIAYLSFFIGIIIICFAHSFTILFLGEKWLPMVPAMQILTLWGVLRSIGATTGPIWQALGTPKKVTKIQIIQVLIMILIIYPMTITWGINGTAWSVVIAAFIPIFIALYQLQKTLQYQWQSFFKELLVPLLASFSVILVYLASEMIYIGSQNIIVFFLIAFLCAFSYFATTIFFSKIGKYSIYKNILDLSNTIAIAKKYNKLLKYLS